MPNKMDKQRIDQIITFSLLESNRKDDPWDRELGPIHLIKYVYLSDLAYAEHHHGITYTGTPWRFHHYGPWGEEVYERIDLVMQAVEAKVKAISSPKLRDDFFRYSLDDDERYYELYSALPLEITSALKKAIHTYGNDTAELLHYVYRTRPMICAAPGESLIFESKKLVEEEIITESQIPKEEISVKRKKLKKEAIDKLKEEMAVRLEKTLTKKKEKRQFTPPRYDDVYYEGVMRVESLAGDPIETEEGVLEVTPNLWKSSFRTDDELC